MKQHECSKDNNGWCECDECDYDTCEYGTHCKTCNKPKVDQWTYE